jgi:hypothetical protein
VCDYSLHETETRPAQVGDRLTTRMFNSGTRGFCAPENKYVAVCVLPGTELSFADNVRHWRALPSTERVVKHRTAIFRKINRQNPIGHRDALEFPSGEIVLLNTLEEGQLATVLQLPAEALGLATHSADRSSYD